MINFFIYLGKKFLGFLYFIGGLSQLALQTTAEIFHTPFNRGRFLKQIIRIGIESLPIVSLLALFNGIILALNTAYQMQRMGSEMYIAGIVSLSMLRELGPVLTALIVAGRCGAAITAEIGTMKVTEQIDALKTLAMDPVKYLVVPRFLALVFMLPILALYAESVGIMGGYIMGVHKLHIASSLYLNITFDSLVLKDLFTGLTKTVFFGMIIALVSCLEGFRVEGGAEGVGKATTACVVASFILIIAADCFFTALFYFIL